MYVKGLNGIRAIAALVLLLGHASQEWFALWCESDAFLKNGGVQRWLPVCCAYVFFVISGFLSGVKSTNNRTLGKYYKNKERRILPLYYFYIVVSLFVFLLLGRSDEIVNINLLYYVIPVPQLPFSGLGAAIIPLVHLWFVGSLALFYFIFPVIEWLSGRRLLYISSIIAILWFMLKCALYLFVGKDTFIYKFVGVSAIDCLFGGVALGILVKENNSYIKQVVDSKLVAIIAWLLFILSGLYGDYVPSPIRVEYIASITGLLILSQLHTNPIINLENKFFNWIGGISYEIYVMQILVIISLSTLYEKLNFYLPAFIIYMSVVFVVTLVAFCTNKLLSRIVR